MDTLVGTSIGGYTLIRLLGAGGMGSVYLANDPTIGQQVAVKVIRTDLDAFTDSSAAQMALERFRLEARSVASLDHLHILPLYRYGEEPTSNGQRAYMIMQYRPEGSLWDWLRRRADLAAGNIQPTQAELASGLPMNWPLKLEEVAEYLQQASSALQYAHDRGIVHRDIKPANFLLRIDMQEKMVHLLLSDFGLAKVFSASSATQTILGTPTYMAPEQFEGAARPESDQYSLAVMVYYLLAGRPPFEGDPMQLMRQHLTVEMPALTTFNPSIPSALNAVLARALAKQPEQRFPTISAFAEAFAKVLKAPQAPSSLAISRPAPSNPTMMDQPPVSSPGLLGLPSNDPAGRRPLILPGTPNPAPGQGMYNATLPADYQAQTMYNAPSPTVYPTQGAYNTPSPTPAGNMHHNTPIRPPHPGGQQVNRRSALGWILGGAAALVAVGGGMGAYFYINSNNQYGQTGNQGNQGNQPGTPSTNILQVFREHTAAVTSLSWLPTDGSQLASGSLDRTVRLWSPSDSNSLNLISGISAVRSVAWNPTGTTLAIGREDRSVNLWYANGSSPKPEPAWGATITALAWDQRYLFIGTYGNGLHTLDSTNFKRSGRNNPNVRVNGIAVSPDDTLLALALASGEIYFADITKNGEQVATIPADTNNYGAALSIDWSPDSAYVAVGYQNNVAVVYNASTKQWKYSIQHDGPVNSVAWRPNATTPTLASGSNDNIVRVARPGVDPKATMYHRHIGAVLSVTWNPAGTTLASASADKTVILWKIPA